MKNLVKISFAVIILFMFSCQQPAQPDQATGRDVRTADLAVSDVFAFSVDETGNGKTLVDTVCYTVETVINADTTRTTTITFDSNCTFDDGTVRGGQIVINWDFGWLMDSTKSVTVTFNNYSIDGNIVDGELEIRFKRGNLLGSQNPVHEIVEKDMSIVLADGEGNISWEGTRTVEWLQGIATIGDKNDNIVLVDVYKDGINRNGEHYIAEGDNLKVDNTCGNGSKITSGIFTITKDDGVITTIDFGEGECDDSFDVTQDGTTIVVNP